MKKRNSFCYENALITLKNMRLAVQMNALVHPFSILRERAEAELPVYAEAISRLAPDMSKNAALNMLAGLQPDVLSALAAVPNMRTRITSGTLDTLSHERSFEAARELCSIGRSLLNEEAMTLPGDELERHRWDWIESAISRLEDGGKTKGVHFDRLGEISIVAVNSYRTERTIK